MVIIVHRIQRMNIYIKNMVCHRCRIAVRNELEKLGLRVLDVQLGEASVDGELTSEQLSAVEQNLEALGFGLMDDKRSRLIERIKSLIIERVQEESGDQNVNLSDYLTDRLHHDYSYLSALFSEVEGTTIEKYAIAQKIEKVKELLVYDELSLSEIAYRLSYSSVAHLSNQFKKVTGLTPGYFKKMKPRIRKPLDEV
ncbi:transcriptional regulator, AraC family [Bacteroidales bacterium 6E]|nr:transcriptional regulator, AraC family [Bacteroidales bacterium 6E]